MWTINQPAYYNTGSSSLCRAAISTQHNETIAAWRLVQGFSFVGRRHSCDIHMYATTDFYCQNYYVQYICTDTLSVRPDTKERLTLSVPEFF